MITVPMALLSDHFFFFGHMLPMTLKVEGLLKLSLRGARAIARPRSRAISSCGDRSMLMWAKRHDDSAKVASSVKGDAESANFPGHERRWKARIFFHYH